MTQNDDLPMTAQDFTPAPAEDKLPMEEEEKALDNKPKNPPVIVDKINYWGSSKK